MLLGNVQILFNANTFSYVLEVDGSCQLLTIKFESMGPLKTCIVMLPQIPLMTSLPLMQLFISDDFVQFKESNATRTNKG
jgi:hypothetical protein